MSDLEPAAVEPLFLGALGRPYLHLRETPSTQLALLGTVFPEGTTAVAEHQTCGRGRRGRAWEDTPGKALLLSVLLRPPPASSVSQLSLVAGLAVADAIAETSAVGTAVKWPNDVLAGGRKLAGILLEAGDAMVVCGIGVNVNQPRDELPTGRRESTSLLVETGEHHDRGALLASILAHLEQGYTAWRGRGLAPLLGSLGARDALRGRRVRIGGIEGVADGIAPTGAIVVATATGERILVESGEVELLP